MTIADGDDFTAAKINTEQQSVLDRLANLDPTTDVEPRAFDTQHLPNLLGDDTVARRLTQAEDTSGYSGAARVAPRTDYNNALAATAAAINLETVAGVGPGAGPGFRELTLGPGATRCEITFSSPLDPTAWHAIRVHGSVWLADYNSTVAALSWCLVLGLFAEDSLGNTKNIATAAYSLYGAKGQRCPINATFKGLPSGLTANINRFFLAGAVGSIRSTDYPTISGLVPWACRLGYGNISYIPIHADELT